MKKLITINLILAALGLSGSCSFFGTLFMGHGGHSERYTGPKLPIGMNIPGLVYWTPATPFTDAMTTAGEWITFYSGGPWDSGVREELSVDQQGYPTHIPQNTSASPQTLVRAMINNYYQGTYQILFDGTGTLGANAYQNPETGEWFIDLSGEGGHNWISIEYSDASDPMVNLRILPMEYASNTDYPVFLDSYLQGLRPFHALRFMDWVNTNNSDQVHWADRVSPDYYTQGGNRGMSMESAIALSNELQANPWVCAPHLASDDYIREMARLWRDNLDPGLTIYLEYSNEIWNWQFQQAHWVSQNARAINETWMTQPEAVDSYVVADLEAIEASGGDFPEKGAYMMARVFRIWEEEFSDSSRIIRVATAQHAWVGNTRRILDWLYGDHPAANGADALSVGGYVGLGENEHNHFLALGAAITPEEITSTILEAYPLGEAQWTRDSAALAEEFDLAYLVYEGGQHMQPYQQSADWSYNQALWDSQISPGMYEIYAENFWVHTDPEVDCDLFMAFSYVGQRESQYGSWGHLESLNQIGSNYMSTAPKYQALLDANSWK